MSKLFMHIYDGEGKSAGLWISPQLLANIEPELMALLQRGHRKEISPPLQEPLEDWKSLVEYGDFPYPVLPAVTCGNCQSTTVNWQTDSPRKFVLVAANFGGLVSFACQNCRSRVIRRHFKDGIQEETLPPRG